MLVQGTLPTVHVSHNIKTHYHLFLLGGSIYCLQAVNEKFIMPWPASFVFAYAHPVTQHYRKRRVLKLSICVWKHGRFTSMTAHASLIDEPPWKGERAITLCFQCCVTFYKTLKGLHDIKNISAITAVTKSSKKPWSSADANRHQRGSGQSNGK